MNPSAPTAAAGTVILPPQLFGTVAYYSRMAAYPAAVIDTGMRFDKRLKSAHRYAVADTRGRLELTVPVSHPPADSPRRWRDTPLSRHGRWWEAHRTALESAYGRTPFFEFYIDRLATVIAEPPDGATVADIVIAADAIVRRILRLPVAVATTLPSSAGAVTDCRADDFAAAHAPRQYWQVRRHTLGFTDSLSILDLIFSLGPEAPLYL